MIKSGHNSRKGAGPGHPEAENLVGIVNWKVLRLRKVLLIAVKNL